MAPLLAHEFNVKSNEDEKFTIDISYIHPEDDTTFFSPYVEMIHQMKQSTIQKKGQEKKRKLEANIKAQCDPSGSNLNRIISLVPELFNPLFPMEEFLNPKKCQTSIACSHKNIYIMGRYQKFSRMISQTPWHLGGKEMVSSFF